MTDSRLEKSIFKFRGNFFKSKLKFNRSKTFLGISPFKRLIKNRGTVKKNPLSTLTRVNIKANQISSIRLSKRNLNGVDLMSNKPTQKSIKMSKRINRNSDKVKRKYSTEISKQNSIYMPKMAEENDGNSDKIGNKYARGESPKQKLINMSKKTGENDGNYNENGHISTKEEFDKKSVKISKKSKGVTENSDKMENTSTAASLDRNNLKTSPKSKEKSDKLSTTERSNKSLLKTSKNVSKIDEIPATTEDNFSKKSENKNTVEKTGKCKITSIITCKNSRIIVENQAKTEDNLTENSENGNPDEKTNISAQISSKTSEILDITETSPIKSSQKLRNTSEKEPELNTSSETLKNSNFPEKRNENTDTEISNEESDTPESLTETQNFKANTQNNSKIPPKTLRRSVSDIPKSSNLDSLIKTDLQIIDEEKTDNFVDFSIPNMLLKANGLKYRSRSTPTMSPSVSAHNSDSESVLPVSSRTKKFLRRFPSVPTTEKVINYYACAKVSDILLQGILYITENYFAFYSNIFGYVNRTLIPIKEIMCIRKEKTAKFIPNAVGIETLDRKIFVFSSLICREATFKFMTHLWRKIRTTPSTDLPTSIRGVTEEGGLVDFLYNTDESPVEDELDFGGETSVKSSLITENNDWPCTPIIPKSSSPSSIIAMKSNRENYSQTIEPTEILDVIQNCNNRVSATPKSSSDDLTTDNPRWRTHPKKPLIKRNIVIKSEDEPVYYRYKLLQKPYEISVFCLCWLKEMAQEFSLLPNSYLPLLFLAFVVFCLMISTTFMIFRVESLNQQFFSDSLQTRNIYRDVLRMQQRLHSAAADQIETTISHQLAQIGTVKRSLESLTLLLNSHVLNNFESQENR